MIVVLAVIGIALTVAGPTLPRARTGEDGDARSVVRVLEKARRTAVIYGQPTLLRMDLQTGSYAVYVSASDAGADGQPADSLVEQGVVSARVGAGAVPNVIRFDAFGRAHGGPVRIGREGGYLEVEIDAWTGRPKIVR